MITTMAASFDPVQDAFDNAMSGFKAELKDDQVYNDILQITTIDQVYDSTNEIQRKQGQVGHLRHLSKISPYLKRLSEYAATIEVFIQAKPDVLALIWGPIKLLLQWTSVLMASFDAVVDTMAEIGELLPEFKRVIALFEQNIAIKEVMVLFFRDILDFYLVALKFFKFSRWKYLFESLWPHHKEKIKFVMRQIQSHVRLMRNEVRLEHIQQEYQTRQLALQHFDSEERERRAQEYHRLKTDIAPQSHDDKLDSLRYLVYRDTGAWLLQDTTFKTWLKSTSKESRILWLQGIPGAGKTCLASEVIKKAESIGPTAFAFLSYKQHRDATAISVIHSLIFRLVSENDDLKTVICQSCSEECKRKLDRATDLLVTILGCTGPAYLIIDGLDEMDEVERGRLLTKLVQTSKSPHEVRLFISSRAEADLVSILRSDATVIQIEQRNLQCIQTFISEWTQSWFLQRKFCPEEQTEIKLGLEPLAPKSRGMFLYARVVLDSIKFLDSFGDIRDELQVFPETLDDAYGRILTRVNKLDNSARREKARLILGWIGCSPTALTVEEIQQALTIDPNGLKNTRKVRGELALDQICGPIVELVDGYVHFVHFTVKEYIFSNRIQGFIDLQASTLSLALRCITYLCQGHHDLNLSDEEIGRNILSGTYVLDYFATNMWQKLVKDYLNFAEQDEPQEELGLRLDELQARRLRYQLPEDDDVDDMHPTFDTFKENYPEAHSLIGQTLRFRQKCTALEYRMYPGDPWIGLDPLTTSESSVRIYQRIQDLLTENKENEDLCKNIQRWYGKRPYKCQYLSCQFSRTGFQDVEQLRLHVKDHERPWKCSFAGCEYMNGGLLTRKMRDDHLDRAHSGKTQQTATLIQLDSDDERPSLLLDLAKLGLVNDVNSLVPPIPTTDMRNGERWVTAMWQAAVLSGSLPMVKWCVSRLGSDAWYSTVRTAVHEKNVEILEYLLAEDTLGSGDYHGIQEAISLGDCNLIRPWINLIESGSLTPDRRHEIDRTLDDQYVISRTANDTSREEVMIQLWRSITNSAHYSTADTGSYWGKRLLRVARTTCSPTLAQCLLESGANVDYETTETGTTPLRVAAKRGDAKAATFMKLMLIHGADPDFPKPPGYGNGRRVLKPWKRIRDEKGPLEISKWLGVTWDQLLDEIQKLKNAKTGESQNL
ncbi:hypothetical protein E0Z10_g9161 [Xylaria hypoxylon]|uniref:NACHT domain-containing protein n=1 Tax=Xylaria hypoxylon TaxID=37992 RepID=A0A4Z0Y6B2_9PEZI|nr:hypothetical protein E0Z10_g9161 [Xylaria hypoxylon]